MTGPGQGLQGCPTPEPDNIQMQPIVSNGTERNKCLGPVRILRGWLIPGLLTIAAAAAQAAATYHIDNELGNDSNSGLTALEAWQTIEQASRRNLQAGDAVLLRRGQVWNSGITNSVSGAAGAWITYGAYGTGPDPLLDISTNISGHALLVTPNVNFVRFENLQLKGNGGGACVLVDWSAGSAPPGYTIQLSNVTVLSNYGRGSGKHDGVALTGTSELEAWNCNVSGCREEPPARGSHQAWTPHTSSRLKVHGGTINDCNHWFIGTANSTAWFDGVTASNCLVNGFGFGADGAESAVCIVSNSTLHATRPLFGMGYVASTNCTLRFVDCSIVSAAGPVAHFNAGKVEFLRCNIYSHAIYNTWKSGAETSATDCQFWMSNGVNGVFKNVEEGGFMRFRGNVFSGPNGPDNILAVWKNTMGHGGGEFVNNLVTNFGSAAASIWIDGGVDNPPAIRNNTFFNSNSNGTAIRNLRAGQQVQVENNIFVNCLPANSEENLIFSHNCFHDAAVPFAHTASFQRDPRFVDVQAGNLHLQPNSPCINAGSNRGVAPDYDLDGRARVSGGTIDLGVYEFPDPGSQISYAWLQNYGMATDGSADTIDPDEDGHSNYLEWRARTNPTDPLSALRMSSIQVIGQNLVLTWESIPSLSYVLEHSAGLLSPFSFSVLELNLPGAVNHTSYTHTNAVEETPRFYRVRIAD